MGRRDVVWITLESVRNDHCSGSYGRATTPNLARLGADGRSFDDCFSHDIWTRSSSASILTGHPPSAHRTWSNDAKLPAAVTTIPEAFRNAGYRTACVTSNGQLNPATGLDRGFDHFHYLNQSTLVEEAGLRSLAGWLVNLRRHSGGITADGRKHCLGYLVNRLATGHVAGAADRDAPLFLYVHHNDTHHAYVPPVAWRDRFADDLPVPVDEAVEFALDVSDRLHEYIAQDDPFTDEEWRTLRVLYDTALAYVDHLTGELVERVQRRLEDPVVVVTADHGELFGEHGLLAHMLVTNAAVSNVPLVVSGLDGLPESGLIQHADVMKMVCADLGIDHPVPGGRDIRTRPREFVVTQRSGARARNKLHAITESNDAFDPDEFHRGDLTSVRTASWRYQTSGERSELFELPDERTDVTDQHPETARDLADRVEEWSETVGRPVGEVERADFDDAAAKQLRDLGYLQ